MGLLLTNLLDGGALARARKRDEQDARDRQRDRDDATLAEHERPRTRSDCAGGERPCPWMGCRHHLALEVTESGSVRIGGRVVSEHDDPDPGLEGMEHTCALDVADAHPSGLRLEGVGALLGITRERVRQIEGKGMKLLAHRARHRGLGVVR